MKNKFLIEQQSPVFVQKDWSSIRDNTLRAYAAAGCFGDYYNIGFSPLDKKTECVWESVKSATGPNAPSYQTFKMYYTLIGGKVKGVKFSATTGSDFNTLTNSNKIDEVILNCNSVKNLVDPPLIKGSVADNVFTYMTTDPPNGLGLKKGSEFQNPSNYKSVKFLEMQKDSEFMTVYGNRIARLGDLIRAVQELPFADNTYFWMPVKKLAKVENKNERQSAIINSYKKSGFFECTRSEISEGGYFYVDLNTDYTSVFEPGNYMCINYDEAIKSAKTEDYQTVIKLCKSMINKYYGWSNPKNPNMTIRNTEIDKLKPVIKKCISDYKTDSKMVFFRKKMNYIDDIKPGNKYSLKATVPLNRYNESEYKLGKLISESLQRLKMKKYNRY